MPILIKPSSITKLFSFRKTMAAASAPLVPKLGQQASVKQAPAPKQRQASARTRENHKSIFSRIANPFKALKERNQSKAQIKTIRKETENKNQSKAQIKTIRKEIENNMTVLKEEIPSSLQNLLEKRNTQGISDSYIRDFSLLEKTFKNEEGTTFPLEHLAELTDKTRDEKKSLVSEQLIEFCGGDKTQAGTLSALLTQETSITIKEKLRGSSEKLGNRQNKTVDSRIDVSMMKNNTARIVIMQDYSSSKKYQSATVKTTIVVPLEDPASMTLDSVDITPTLTLQTTT